MLVNDAQRTFIKCSSADLARMEHAGRSAGHHRQLGIPDTGPRLSQGIDHPQETGFRAQRFFRQLFTAPVTVGQALPRLPHCSRAWV